jgi:hypothetical protein
MYEDVVPPLPVGLTSVQRLVACRNVAAHLRKLARETLGVNRLTLVCRAVEFDQMAAEAERQART